MVLFQEVVGSLFYLPYPFSMEGGLESFPYAIAALACSPLFSTQVAGGLEVLTQQGMSQNHIKSLCKCFCTVPGFLPFNLLQKGLGLTRVSSLIVSFFLLTTLP